VDFLEFFLFFRVLNYYQNGDFNRYSESMKKSIFANRFSKVLVAAVLFGGLMAPLLYSAPQSVSAQNGTSSYVVEKGDTLYSLGRRFGVSVDSLCSANGMDKSSYIKVGQKLVIPELYYTDSTFRDDSAPKIQEATFTEKKYEVHKVQSGDTLYRLALNNGLSVSQIKNYNGLEQDTLQVGQEIKIPLTESEKELASLPSLNSNDPRFYSTKKGDSSLQWPVKNPDVTYMAGKVGGVQLSAQKNEAVTVIQEGTVMFTGNYRGYGQVVLVVSKSGMMYVYAGLGSIKVKKGDYVVFGDSVGTAGTDSIKGTSQISLIVYEKTVPIDPASAPRG